MSWSRGGHLRHSGQLKFDKEYQLILRLVRAETRLKDTKTRLGLGLGIRDSLKVV